LDELPSLQVTVVAAEPLDEAAAGAEAATAAAGAGAAAGAMELLPVDADLLIPP
jgi:hypothetical protein